MFTVKKKQNYPQNLQQSTAYRWQERTKNEITAVADDDCFCLPAAGAVASGGGVSITDMIASYLIHSSYRVFHPA